MRMPHFYISYIFFFLSLTSIYSQSPELPVNKLDEQYTPSSNSLFSETNKGNRHQSNKHVALNAALKAIPFDIMRGNALMEAEIAVFDNSSVAFGVGYNLMNDPMLKNFSSESFLGPSLNYLGFEDIYNHSTFTKGGVCLSFTYRNYVDQLKLGSYGYSNEKEGIAMNDWYRSLTIKYNVQNYDLDTSTRFSNRKVIGNNKVSFKSIWLLTGIGYTAAIDGKVKTIHDFYFSLGARFIRYTEFKLSYDYSTTNNQLTEFYTGTSNGHIQLLFPAIHLGYSLGIGF